MKDWALGGSQSSEPTAMEFIWIIEKCFDIVKYINVEHAIVDTPVHHLIVDHSSIIAAQILVNSGTQRQTTVTTTASFTIIYCSAFCVCFNEYVIFSLSAMRPTQVCTLLTCSEGQWAAVLLQIKTVSHDCAHAAGADFFHEQPSEISEDRQLALTRCWLRVHFLSMTCLPKMLFVIVSISEEQHKEKSTCPRNCEDSQSALKRLLGIIYEPCPHSVLGSHAPFPVTLLYTKRSSPAACCRIFRSILSRVVFFDSLCLCHRECSAFTSFKVPAFKHSTLIYTIYTY